MTETKDGKLTYDLRIDKGVVQVMPKLSDQDFETLKALRASSHWKLYRQILVATRDGHSQAILGQEDTNKVFKTLGQIAGINLAVVQLDLLIEQFDKAKRVREESKNRGKPTP